MGVLVLIRHGESAFNAAQIFTGLLDVDVTQRGLLQVDRAADLLREAGLVPDEVLASSMLRALSTAERLIARLSDPDAAADASSVSEPPPVRTTWRLAERDYGVLTGMPKAEARELVGEEAFFTLRRTRDGKPPAASPEQRASWVDPPPLADSGPLEAGMSESLADVIDRVTPVWEELRDALAGNDRVIAVVAHGNSLRALAAVIDDLDAGEVAELNIPVAHPLVYRVGEEGRAAPRGGEYLDPHGAEHAAELVAAEGGT